VSPRKIITTNTEGGVENRRSTEPSAHRYGEERVGRRGKEVPLTLNSGIPRDRVHVTSFLFLLRLVPTPSWVGSQTSSRLLVKPIRRASGRRTRRRRAVILVTRGRPGEKKGKYPHFGPSTPFKKRDGRTILITILRKEEVGGPRSVALSVPERKKRRRGRAPGSRWLRLRQERKKGRKEKSRHTNANCPRGRSRERREKGAVDRHVVPSVRAKPGGEGKKKQKRTSSRSLATPHPATGREEERPAQCARICDD